MPPFYLPVESERYFTNEKLYSQIKWTSLPHAIEAFRVRLTEWYIVPATKLKGDWHHAFSVLAIVCLFIDTLSQYFDPNTPEAGKRIKEFTRKHLLGFQDPIQPEIDFIKQNGALGKLNDIADVFYHGFRCGILHEAHCPLYGMIAPLAGPAAHKIEVTGSATYSDGTTPCPCVVIDPHKLLDEVTDLFTAYIANLNDKTPNPDNDALRASFVLKMANSFGLTVPSTL